MRGIFLGAGSNLGDRHAQLRQAEGLLGLPLVQKSSIYETEPVDFLNQPWFLNAVWEVETDLSPLDLLARCQSVEQQLHRLRDTDKGPRTIDIDILFYGSRIVDQPSLTIPHPAAAVRRFVLIPLAEISPDFVHPVLGLSIKDLLVICPDRSRVGIFEAPY